MSFYYLSKTLSLLLEPVTHLLLLSLACLFVFYRKNHIWPLPVLMGYVLLVTASPFPLMMILSLENKYRAVTRPLAREAAIVLTGGTVNYNVKLNQYAWHASSERLLEALRLYRRGLVKKIVISGGRLNGSRIFESESISMARYAREQGVKAEDLIVESQSLNTQQNASFLARVPQARQMKDVYLITSAYHMRRALSVFQKAGFKAHPYPVDFTSPPDGSALIWDEGGLRALAQYRIAIREYVGLAVYYYAGYSH